MADGATLPASLAADMLQMGRRARDAGVWLRDAGAERRTAAITAMAEAIAAAAADILAANAADLEAAREAGLVANMLDRLALDPARLAAVAHAVRDIAAIADPVGLEIARWTPAERAGHRPGAHAHRGAGGDLRGAPQRHRRRRSALPALRQRGDPSRRVGVPAHQPGPAPRAGAGPGGRRRTCGLHPARAHRRPRRGGADPAGAGRRRRPGDPARRPGAGGAGAGGGAGGGARPSGRALPHLRPRLGPTRTRRAPSWWTPRCAAPRSAGPPRPC